MAAMTMKTGSRMAVLADVALMKAPRMTLSARKLRKISEMFFPIFRTMKSDRRLARPVATRALAMMKLPMFRIITGSPSRRRRAAS